MPHEGIIIMNTVSEIGHMLVDEKYCPSGVKPKDIMDFFTVMITEFESSFQLKNADLSKMEGDINDYFDYVTSQKNKLIAEEGSAAAAEIASGAAAIAATCLAWLPGVNFALSATAVALAATAMGLEIAADKLQGTVVEEITGADLKIRDKPSFANVKKYLVAQTSNTTFFPRLQFGVTILEMRAVFVASIMALKKESGKSKITNEDLKKKFVDWYNAYDDDETLKIAFSKLYDEMEKNPEDLTPFKEKFDTAIKGLSPKIRQAAIGMSLGLSLTVAIRKGKQFYRIYKSIGTFAKSFGIELSDLDEDGNVAEAGAESGEAEVLTGAEACSMAISFLAGAVSIAFGVLEAIKAADTNETFTKAISKARKDITSYYDKLVNKSH